MDKLHELKKDIDEMEQLMKGAQRQKVKDILSIEVRKLVTECSKLEEVAKSDAPHCSKKTPTEPKHYEVKINNYAWDQTSKFVKFYVTFKDIHTIPVENVTCLYTKKSVELKVKNFENKDYVFNIKNLLYTINEADSNFKIKTDMIIINLAKVDNVNWSHVTEVEKKAKDASSMAPEVDKNADPSDGLMSIMKNMYDKGDDNMKRTIAKAWTDAQDKKATDFSI